MGIKVLIVMSTRYKGAVYSARVQCTLRLYLVYQILQSRVHYTCTGGTAPLSRTVHFVCMACTLYCCMHCMEEAHPDTPVRYMRGGGG